MKNWKFGVFAFGFMICLAVQGNQEKQAVLTLTKADIENLWSIVDESATPGAVRKPLLQKIELAYIAAFQPKPLPKNEVKQDTTKPKPKKN